MPNSDLLELFLARGQPYFDCCPSSFSPNPNAHIIAQHQLKSCFAWSRTSPWTLWLFALLCLAGVLRLPLRISDNLSTVQMGSDIL
uniref:Uncharacterized protein n=1 Tax=Crocodylus porosus TaxID=8502 RepID=A0A7M4EUG6_CROPO